MDDPHDVDCKDVAEEDKIGENSNYDDLMNIFVCANVSNINKEEATEFEEELKFFEAWLETPCLYEVNTEVASMNDEKTIADVQMVDTENSERKNSPIQPIIILRRVRIRVQDFHHWGRNELQIYHYLMERKVKMKPHLGMNKHGLASKKTKMKTYVTKFFKFFMFFM